MDNCVFCMIVKGEIPSFKIWEDSNHLAILDINLNESNKTGIDFLEKLKKEKPDVPVVMLSSLKDIPSVVESMRRGALDYFEKPFESEAFRLRIDTIIKSEETVSVLRRIHEKGVENRKLIGQSKIFTEALKKVEKSGDMRILFIGETGVGKTPFAEYANYCWGKENSRIRPFESYNCSLFADSQQFQDVLYGHIKGAFTGAINDKKGFVELADGGTLFLDEIGDLKPECQTMFLTFLDNYEYRRLGEDKKRKANVRIISATNKNLEEMVQRGEFRKDLYSRIAQVKINIPALRERKEDIKLLFDYFIEKTVGYKKQYDAEVYSKLINHNFTDSNIRELEIDTKYMCISSKENEKICIEDMPEKYFADNLPIINKLNDINEIYSMGFLTYINAFEKYTLQTVLENNRSTYDIIAKDLQLSRSCLYKKLERYNLKKHEIY